MEVERNRASGSPLRQLNEDPGVSAKRRSAFAEVFLSLRRHDPDQVRRVSAPRLTTGQRRLSPLPGHPLEEAIICRVRAGRQGCGLMTRSQLWPDLIPAFTCPTLRALLPEKLDHRVKPGDD